MSTRHMRLVVFGHEGAWTTQRAELCPDGWHRWPGARPTAGHRVDLREGDLVLPWPVTFEAEAALRIPPRLRGRGELELHDHEVWAQAEALDRVSIEGELMRHAVGTRIVQSSGSDWQCEQLFVEVPETESEPIGLSLAAQSDRSEVSLAPWRPEAGVWQVRPPRDLGPLRLRHAEPVWLGETELRRPASLRRVWRLGDGSHPRLELINSGLSPGRSVELFVEGERRSEQRAGPSGELQVGHLESVEVELRSEADQGTVHHLLQARNESPRPISFDWRLTLDPEDAGQVLEMEADGEWDTEGLRIPVWIPAKGRAEATLRLRMAGAASVWTPTQS
ncbi:MAG: hypothetical protein AAGD10_08170 [Myxococcota bacterium]